ncbi:MAG: 5'/3'-nucleotidase SurE, partial [Anaerolineae bacterium]|nr:5'/3'-nucleotidase SurE [Anaerolineae bacterium]
LALKRALEKIGNVFVLAPDHNWSASGHTKTMHKPLRVKPVQLDDGSQALACSGAPSDCVALALLGVLPHMPDLVVSGINPGSNLGLDVTYSGTVSAAWEAVVTHIPAIAVSLGAGENLDFTFAADYAGNLANTVLHMKPAQPMLLNLNVPNLPAEEITGVEITRLGQLTYHDVLEERRDPRGHSYYWIGGDQPPTAILEPGTDVAALAQGKISITPIQLDLTNHSLIKELRHWKLGL